MTLYQILSLLGVGSLFTGAVGIFHDRMRRVRVETACVKTGIQALLRAQMINDYNKWSAKGYAPIYAKDNFENCWQSYHSLGANGVMDDIHIKFLALPTEPKEVMDV